MMIMVTIISLIVIGFLDLQSKDFLPMEERVEDLTSIRPPDPKALQTRMPKITIMVFWVIYMELKTNVTSYVNAP